MNKLLLNKTFTKQLEQLAYFSINLTMLECDQQLDCIVIQLLNCSWQSASLTTSSSSSSSSSSSVDQLDAGCNTSVSNPICRNKFQSQSRIKINKSIVNSTLLQLPVNNMLAFQLYRTSRFTQNLSRRALNVFVVGDATK